jgi:hypothetical protein
MFIWSSGVLTHVIRSDPGSASRMGTQKRTKRVKAFIPITHSIRHYPLKMAKIHIIRRDGRSVSTLHLPTSHQFSQ